MENKFELILIHVVICSLYRIYNIDSNYIPYFLNYKTHPPPNLGGKWGCIL